MASARPAAAELAVAWRCAALAGLTAGLAAAPLIGDRAVGGALIWAALAAVAGLVLTAPHRGPAGRAVARSAAAIWLALVAAAAAAAGIAVGGARIAAVDAGALDLEPGARVTVRGFAVAVPRRSDGRVDVRVETAAGRLMVEAPEPVADLGIGTAIEATGTIRAPSDFDRDYLARLGITRILSTRAIDLRSERRTGFTGLLDRVRERAQVALTAGTPESSSALLRGFVLGQDDRIESATVDAFKRSGLAHLLAVSGQNVVLLAVLATTVLALAGVSIRARWVAILALIGVYVLVTGAGPSIQRAGVMGAAGIAAALAGRPRSRWYVLGLAAAATLGLDPRAAADIGWQLSFAAVAGILLFCGPLARALAAPGAGRARRALAEAAALTISATLATAPLMAFHFGTVSLVSLPANLVAVVAEAPAMWLGMTAAGAGQVDWLPIEPITWLAGLLAAYIAQIAEWFALPSWAQIELEPASAAALACSYALLGGALSVGLRWIARRRHLRPARTGRPSRGRRRLALAALVSTLVVALAIRAPLPSPAGGSRGGTGLLVSVLDVGQGDSILLQPAGGRPVLVDAGAADAGVASELAARGVDRLAALLITHGDSDHAGGAPDVLGSLAVSHLLFGRANRAVLGAARARATDVARVAAGSMLRSADLRLRVLWPPRGLLGDPAGSAEPNAGSLVVLARWRGFRMLLTGDGEAEIAPVHPGDIDVLKVAHHGSDDAGLPALLAEAEPELAVISVGADNPYGHPTAATLASLREAGVPVLRTDLNGELSISVSGSGRWAVAR